MRGCFYYRSSTEKGRRSILLPPFVVEALKQHRARQLEARLKAGAAWQEHDYVFCTSVGTHLHPTRDVLNQLKVLLAKAGLPDIRFHDLRHSSATMLLSMGGSSSQDRAGDIRAQPDQHDVRYLLARLANHAKRGDEQAQRAPSGLIPAFAVNSAVNAENRGLGVLMKRGLEPDEGACRGVEDSNLSTGIARPSI